MTGADVVQIDDDDDLYRHLRPGAHVKRNGQVAAVAFMVKGVPDDKVSVDLARLTTLERSIAPRRAGGWGLEC